MISGLRKARVFQYHMRRTAIMTFVTIVACSAEIRADANERDTFRTEFEARTRGNAGEFKKFQGTQKISAEGRPESWILCERIDAEEKKGEKEEKRKEIQDFF